MAEQYPPADGTEHRVNDIFLRGRLVDSAGVEGCHFEVWHSVDSPNAYRDRYGASVISHHTGETLAENDDLVLAQVGDWLLEYRDY